MTERFRSIDGFLALLQGVEPQGKDEWKALCPNHYDRDPSLTITLSGNRILLHDFGGCETPAIVKTLGLTMSHLFLDDGSKPDSARGRPRRGTCPRARVAEYVYTDEHGKRLYRKLRYEPKSFDLERAEGVGGWVGGTGCLKGVRRVLWDLPRVLTADIVYWVEGEKDAINMATMLDVIATTCVEGAPMNNRKWKDSYAIAMKGRHLVLVPDLDQAGISHALFIAGKLTGIAASVKVVLLPTGYKDVSDWLAVNRKDEWEELLSTARDFTSELVTELTALYGEPLPAPETQGGNDDGHRPQADTGDDHERVTNTDVGNAVRLCRQYGNILRYCYEAKKWLAWNGKHWEWDLGARINHYATLTVKSIYREAANADTAEQSRELAKHAMASESNNRIMSMICRAESQPGIPVKMVDLDTQDWLITCRNGTIDLRTGELLPHNPDHLITCMLDVDYDPAAKCPHWMAFLDRVCASDPELMWYLQKCVGYSLTGSVVHEVVYFIYGEGQNGKSTFLGTIRKLVGPYGWRVNPDMFMTKGKNQPGPRESLANLKGKRFVVGSEVEDGKRFAMSLIKATTGAETIQADRKYEHEVEFQPTHKLWLFGNYRPEVRDTTVGAWRRLKLIPFEVKIPDSEKDVDLKSKLQAELSGILAWAVEGCIAYQREGIADPTAVTSATEKYRKEQDVFGTFLEECCIINKGESVPKAAFRADLKAWCISNNVDAFTTHQVSHLMTGMGIEDGSDGKRRLWKGLRLRNESDPLPGPESKSVPKMESKADNTDNSDKTTTEGLHFDKTQPALPEVLTRENSKEKFPATPEVMSKCQNDTSDVASRGTCTA